MYYKKPKGLIAETIHILPGVPMQIMATPGHSLGGMVFYFPIQKILMTGDTIFKDGIGRYDLPGGNANELRNSISKIAAKNFPDDTYVVHGHGDDSVIKWLRENNPWFKCKA